MSDTISAKLALTTPPSNVGACCRHSDAHVRNDVRRDASATKAIPSQVRNSAAVVRQIGGALPDLLTPEEVANWLSTTVKAVYAKAERGTLPGATRVGRRLYFVRADLLKLVEQGRVPYQGDPGDGT